MDTHQNKSNHNNLEQPYQFFFFFFQNDCINFFLRYNISNFTKKTFYTATSLSDKADSYFCKVREACLGITVKMFEMVESIRGFLRMSNHWQKISIIVQFSLAISVIQH